MDNTFWYIAIGAVVLLVIVAVIVLVLSKNTKNSENKRDENLDSFRDSFSTHDDTKFRCEIDCKNIHGHSFEPYERIYETSYNDFKEQQLYPEKNQTILKTAEKAESESLLMKILKARDTAFEIFSKQTKAEITKYLQDKKCKGISSLTKTELTIIAANYEGFNKLNKDEIILYLRERNISGYSNKNKTELVELALNAEAAEFAKFLKTI